MKTKCDYCGNFIDNTQEKCPCCGSVNKHVNRVAKGNPTTIAELERFANDHNLPLEKMRFFIGEDFRGPRAFGIYKDIPSGDCIVYKNHSDASRSVRYKGPDENYAVNEIFQKLKQEMNNQMQLNPKIQKKNASSANSNSNDSEKTGQGLVNTRNKAGNINKQKNIERYYTIRNLKANIRRILGIIGDIISFTLVLGPIAIPILSLIVVFIVGICSEIRNYKYDGYYEYQGETYVSHQGNWYEYAGGAWNICDLGEDIEFKNNYKSYFVSKDYSSTYDFSDFEDSSVYSELHEKKSYSSDSTWSNYGSNNSSWSSSSNWGSNWNSSWNYDWGNWNSGYTNWNSDW